MLWVDEEAEIEDLLLVAVGIQVEGFLLVPLTVFGGLVSCESGDTNCLLRFLTNEFVFRATFERCERRNIECCSSIGSRQQLSSVFIPIV